MGQMIICSALFLINSHKDEFSIVPVLVGALSESKEQEYGKLLSKYLADPSNLFIISSDFCHWGLCPLTLSKNVNKLQSVICEEFPVS